MIPPVIPADRVLLEVRKYHHGKSSPQVLDSRLHTSRDPERSSCWVGGVIDEWGNGIHTFPFPMHAHRRLL